MRSSCSSRVEPQGGARRSFRIRPWGVPCRSRTLESVILGAGFGGLEATKALGRAPVEITLIDRQNYHCFQPLLYQVATAALSPADIAWPIRNFEISGPEQPDFRQDS